MKKFLLSIALCCAATNFFAQTTEPGNLINEGKAALEAKNYQEAFTKFSTYLTQKRAEWNMYRKQDRKSVV